MWHIFSLLSFFQQEHGERRKAALLQSHEQGLQNKLSFSHPQTREREPHALITFQQHATSDLVELPC